MPRFPKRKDVELCLLQKPHPELEFAAGIVSLTRRKMGSKTVLTHINQTSSLVSISLWALFPHQEDKTSKLSTSGLLLPLIAKTVQL